MADVTTLVLTRFPVRDFRWGIKSGRWGELIAIKGPKVTQAWVSSKESWARVMGYQRVKLDNRTLHLSTDEQPVTEVKRWTSMERYHADDGTLDYVRLRPQADPYVIQIETGNPVVATHPGHDGKCFRINGGRTFKERAILIHEAPNVAWLTGCIAPRPLNDTQAAYNDMRFHPSRRALEEMFRFFGYGKSNFFVSSDWS